MTDTKLGKAFREYQAASKSIAEWILGLTIGELALILSQTYYQNNWEAIVMLLFVFLIGVICIAMMYVIISNDDVELFTAMYSSLHKDLSGEDFKNKYYKRLGSFSVFVNDLVIEKKLYNWLFGLFLLNSFWMMFLIIKKIITG